MHGISAITYPQTAKLQKQMKFADRLGIESCNPAWTNRNRVNSVTIKNLARTVTGNCIQT